MSMPVRMPVSVPVPVRMPMFTFILIRMPKFIFMVMVMVMVALMCMRMIVIVIVIVPTVIVSFHPAHLTLVVPATTYSSPAAGVVAPPHNTAKFE